MNEIIYLIIGIAIGFVIGFLLMKLRSGNSGSNSIHAEIELKNLKSQVDEFKNEIKSYLKQLEDFREKNISLEKELAQEKGRIEKSFEVFHEQKSKLNDALQKNEQLNALNSKLEERSKHLETNLAEHKGQVEELQKKFTVEFENLANRILDEKTQKFTHQNKEQLGNLITPFQEKIKEFEKKVEETYVKGTQERSALMEQVKQLADLNQQMRSDAQQLTNALKGDKKQQGNWGELILEKILESSGLTKDHEYQLQFNTTGTEGGIIQPDVVINLPDHKHLIIDSKVSLNAYTEWINESDEQRKEVQLKTHLGNIKNHIKSLSEKNYHSAQALNSPEFVLMFIPVESSFSTIIQHDNTLWDYAWERKIVIVSPSTLLATLRTIASVWKQEKQNANSREIARQAGEMYDKFVGFLEDMSKIEKNIEQTQRSYADAYNKLKDGSGNLIRRAEKLKELGIKTDKTIAQKHLDSIE